MTETARLSLDQTEQQLRQGYSLTFGEWVRVRFFGVDVYQHAAGQFRNLTIAIRRYPEAPANYILRGELYLKAHMHSEAAADFQRALDLASADYAASAWGLLPQALQDRALHGLAETEPYR
jgi:tetratricopeptide (TPR) repeat protein